MNELGPTNQTPSLPVVAVAQPRGAAYFFGTWSGRILLANMIVFLYICWRSGSIFSPDTATLLALGAKDPVNVAQGQLWRLLAPIFIHIGIIHFAFNSYFLYVVGYQLERMLGPPWYLTVYLLSGIAGNIASAAFSVNMSAGASSSLFGLLGAGVLLERSIGTRIKQLTGHRPKHRAYALTVLINLGIGLVIPFIDNSAHIGGLIGGMLLTLAMMNLRVNNLRARHRGIGVAALVVFAGLCSVGVYLSVAPRLVLGRLVAAGDKSEDPEERIYRYTQALTLDPDDVATRIKRAREFFAEGADNYAFNDLRAVMAKGDHDLELGKLAEELDAKGHQSAAWELRQMIAHSGTGI